MNVFSKVFGTRSQREVKRIMPLVEKTESYQSQMQQLTDEQLRDKTIKIIYNIICIPLAAGVLHIFGIDFQITPMWASALMAFSSVSVVLNSLRLRLA